MAIIAVQPSFPSEGNLRLNLAKKDKSATPPSERRA